MSQPRRRAGLLVALGCMLLCAGSLDRTDGDEAALVADSEELRQQALEEFSAKQARVLNVSYRLKVAGGSLSGEAVAPLLDAAIARRFDLVPTHTQKEQTEQALGLADQVKVISVVDDSPADRCGIRSGDLILGVDGSSTPKTARAFQRLRGAKAGDPVLEITREGWGGAVKSPGSARTSTTQLDSPDPGSWAVSSRVVPGRACSPPPRTRRH